MKVKDKSGEYTKDKIQCPYCKKYYRKVASHAWQVHNVYNRELKAELGLDVRKGLIPEADKEVLRKHVKYNYNVVVGENLLKKGIKTRVKKGEYIKYKRSPETLARLKVQFKNISK